MSKERREADRRHRNFVSAIDGHCHGSVICACGSHNVLSYSRFNADRKRIVAIEYTCRDCGARTEIRARSRGQLELERREELEDALRKL